MKKYYNFHDVLQASVERALEEEVSPFAEKAVARMQENYRKEQAQYEYVYSPQRDQIFQKMEKTAVCLGKAWSMNVAVSYLEDDSYDGDIVMSSSIIDITSGDPEWRKEFCWLISTAEICIIESKDDIFLIVISYPIYDKVLKNDKTPEA